MGQGLRRRPRHPHRRPAWPCCGWTGCARWSTSTPASSARTRWSPRSTTACTAGAARRRRSTPRCTAWSTPPHVDHLHPDAGHRARHRGRRRGADQGVLRRPGGLGAVAAPRLPARPGHRRGATRPTRRRSASILGGHGITAWGATSDECEAQLAGDHPHRAGVPRRARPRRAVRAGRCPVRRRCPDDAPGPGRRAGAGDPRPGLHRPAAGRPLHRRRRWCWTSWPATEHPRLAALGTSCPDHFLRTKVRPAGARPAAGAPLDERSPGSGAARGRTAPTTPPTTSGTPTPGLAADARRRPGDRAGARRRHVQLRRRTSRPPGWPASSTSTRST